MIKAKNKQKIILASGSKNRQEILRALGYPFKIVISNFDEKKVKETDPKIRAAKIAFGKGKSVAERHSGIIIAGDTFTVCQGEILEKPESQGQAKEMLRKLSGNKTTGYTGFYFLDRKNKIEVSRTVATKVTFRKIYEKEIEGYVKAFPVITWAAAYSPSELYVLGLIKSISGSVTGWMYALPSELLVPLLKRSGYEPKA